MPRAVLAAALLLTALHPAAFAACTADDAMTKYSDISEALAAKLSSKPDEASKIMSESGDVMGADVTPDTCTKLDALLARAKKL